MPLIFMEKLSQSLQKEWENSWVIIHTHPVSEAFQVLASDWLKILWANQKTGNLQASGTVSVRISIMYLEVFPFFVNFTCYGFACEFSSLIN